jgi:hypothetical protein
LREWSGARTAVLIAFIVAVALLASSCQEHYSIGVITEPTSDKARLGAIAITEARARGVDHITLFFAESEAALQRRDVFGGAHLIRPKRSLTVDLGR